jgi:hypothetical protein
MKNKKGVALLMSLSILALLSVVGISFATAMRLGQRSAQDFFANIQAKYFAEGGMQRAIAEFKYNHTLDWADPDSSQGALYQFLDHRGEGWYYKSKGNNQVYYAGTPLENAPVGVPVTNEKDLSGSDDILLGKGYTAHYDLKVIDAGSQINVNDSNNGNLQALLRNLCAYLGAPLDQADADAIFNGKPYHIKGAIEYVFAGTTDAKKAKYDKIKDFITINGYKDPNNSNKTPININTASWQVIASVLKEIPAVGNNAETVAKNLCNDSVNGVALTYPCWGGFDYVMGAAGLNDNTKTAINNSVNPNRTNNAATDTKFNFNSGGYYDVECLAVIRDAQNNIVARKKISSQMKVFDMWNMTTKEQFRGEDANYNGSFEKATEDTNGNGLLDGPLNYDRVTWFDSCPLNITQSYNGYQYNSANNAETIPGSLKLGYWDDFDEDVNYSNSVWKTITGSFNIQGGTINGVQGWPVAGLGFFDNYNKKLRWEYFSIWVQVNDVRNPPPNQDANHYARYGAGKMCYYDVGAHLFVNSSSDILGGQTQYDICLSRLDPKDTCPYFIQDRLAEHVIQPENGYPANYGINLEGYFEEVDSYLERKTFKFTRKPTDNVTANVHAWGENGEDYTMSWTNLGDWINRAGLVRLYSANSGFRADNIRIIGTCTLDDQMQQDTAAVGGYYDYSPNILNMPANYEWGCGYTTVTRPSTANGDSEKVRLSTRAKGGANWNLVGESVATKLTASGQIQATNSMPLEYRLELTTANANYTETPVVEDVWFTYLPKTKILYWREN